MAPVSRPGPPLGVGKSVGVGGGKKSGSRKGSKPSTASNSKKSSSSISSNHATGVAAAAATGAGGGSTKPSGSGSSGAKKRAPRSRGGGGGGGGGGQHHGKTALPWRLDKYEKMVNSFIHAVYARPTPQQMKALFDWAHDWARANCLEWSASREERALVHWLLEQKVQQLAPDDVVFILWTDRYGNKIGKQRVRREQAVSRHRKHLDDLATVLRTLRKDLLTTATSAGGSHTGSSDHHGAAASSSPAATATAKPHTAAHTPHTHTCNGWASLPAPPTHPQPPTHPLPTTHTHTTRAPIVSTALRIPGRALPSVGADTVSSGTQASHGGSGGGGGGRRATTTTTGSGAHVSTTTTTITTTAKIPPHPPSSPSGGGGGGGSGSLLSAAETAMRVEDAQKLLAKIIKDFNELASNAWAMYTMEDTKTGGAASRPSISKRLKVSLGELVDSTTSTAADTHDDVKDPMLLSSLTDTRTRTPSSSSHTPTHTRTKSITSASTSLSSAVGRCVSLSEDEMSGSLQRKCAAVPVPESEPAYQVEQEKSESGSSSASADMLPPSISGGVNGPSRKRSRHHPHPQQQKGDEEQGEEEDDPIIMWLMRGYAEEKA